MHATNFLMGIGIAYFSCGLFPYETRKTWFVRSAIFIVAALIIPAVW